MKRLINRWERLFMKFAGPSAAGRFACWLAGIFSPPYYGKIHLAGYGRMQYFAPGSTVFHRHVKFGRGIFIGDKVLVYEDEGGGSVDIAPGVHIHRDTVIQTGQGGSVVIGENSHIQPRCQFSGYLGHIRIGSQVEIAPNCSFYPYAHGMAAGTPLGRQPLTTKGGIVIEDDVWIGVGTVILDGVTIGKGAVIGAGSVVSKSIPENAIAVGAPAKVVKIRD